MLSLATPELVVDTWTDEESLLDSAAPVGSDVYIRLNLTIPEGTLTGSSLSVVLTGDDVIRLESVVNATPTLDAYAYPRSDDMQPVRLRPLGWTGLTTSLASGWESIENVVVSGSSVTLPLGTLTNQALDNGISESLVIVLRGRVPESGEAHGASCTISAEFLSEEVLSGETTAST